MPYEWSFGSLGKSLVAVACRMSKPGRNPNVSEEAILGEKHPENKDSFTVINRYIYIYI